MKTRGLSVEPVWWQRPMTFDAPPAPVEAVASAPDTKAISTILTRTLRLTRSPPRLAGAVRVAHGLVAHQLTASTIVRLHSLRRGAHASIELAPSKSQRSATGPA